MSAAFISAGTVETTCKVSLFFYAGTGETAKNLKYLLDIGVTHLLNTAESDVNVNPKRYTKEGISYKGFRCPDLPQADIGQFFDECVEFIDRALSFSCGKVFVNCLLVRKLIVFNSVQFYPETKVHSLKSNQSVSML